MGWISNVLPRSHKSNLRRWWCDSKNNFDLDIKQFVFHLCSAAEKFRVRRIIESRTNPHFLFDFSEKPTFAHAFYFWLSLIYLIGRTLAVSLYSASINDESKKPLEVFRAVSRHDWCVEVKRFNEEVANDTIALSGMKFFNFTRSLVLSVAGTIVTYELVLIQFHTSDTITDYDPCLRWECLSVFWTVENLFN